MKFNIKLGFLERLIPKKEKRKDLYSKAGKSVKVIANQKVFPWSTLIFILLGSIFALWLMSPISEEFGGIVESNQTSLTVGQSNLYIGILTFAMVIVLGVGIYIATKSLRRMGLDY